MSRRRIPGLLAIGIFGVLIGAIVTSFTPLSFIRSTPPSPRPITRFAISLPSDHQLPERFAPPLALAPDGTRLVYASAPRGGQSQLYLRSLDQLEARSIPGTEGARDPFFSHDGQEVGFFAGGKLQRVSVSGGRPLTICDVPSSPTGASLGPDGTIIFSTLAGSLMQISAAGGTPEALPAQDEMLWRPQILPDGEVVLGTINTSGDPQIAVVSLTTGERRILLPRGGGTERFIPSKSKVVYSRSGALLAVPFDLVRLEPSGSPVSILDGIYTRRGVGYFAVSDTGSIVYAPGRLAEKSLVWVDREGRAKPLTEDRHVYAWPRLSPDGRRLAVTIESEAGETDIWIYDLERDTRSRLTADGENIFANWTPDGTRVTFTSIRSGGLSLFWKPADGSGEAEPILTREGPQYGSSWSPDGRILAFFRMSSTTATDIWMLLREGDRPPSPFLATPFYEQTPMFSPDGRFLAYASTESGQTEVYVRPYPGPGGVFLISTEGGQEPVWSADGRELFYRNGNRMMAVAVST